MARLRAAVGGGHAGVPHNELAGGSANAYRQFGNEGLDLGQRFHELRAFHDRHIAGSGLPLYVDY